MTLSAETRQKMAVAHTGLKHSKATKRKIGAASSMRWKTEEFRTKLKGKLVGRKRSIKARHKMSVAHLGQKQSEEHKLKIAAAMKRAWAKRKAQQSSRTH
jgi:hypothetical protein